MMGQELRARHSPPPTEARCTALQTLDEHLRATRGGMLTIGGSPADLLAARAHARRRAVACQRAFVEVDGRSSDEPWREVALTLGAALGPAEQVAEAILKRSVGALVMVQLEGSTAWGRAIAETLKEMISTSSAVVVLFDEHHQALRLDSPAAADDLDRYYEALVEAHRAEAATKGDLTGLDHWWQAARQTRQPSPSACAAAARLALLRLSCTRKMQAKLGAEGSSELLALGWAEETHGLLRPREEKRANTAEAARVAEILQEELSDAWAVMRAAELWQQAGRLERSHQAGLQALALAPDAACRTDLWSRWMVCLSVDGDGNRLLASAELALVQGHGDEALELARRAAACPDAKHQAALTVGLAARAKGDLGAAGKALNEARNATRSANERAAVDLELAELALDEGERQRARLIARQLIATSDAATPETTRLGARNVLGKILLAEGAWSDAQAHFEADESYAARYALWSGEQRARVNRSIALLSGNRRSEARALLHAVLEEGTKRGEDQACAFALSNLSIVSSQIRDYGPALTFIQRAIDVMRALGDPLRLTQLVANLAELRLQVGMVDEAEQALAFARRCSGPAPGVNQVALLCFVTARTALARGNTLRAAAELDDAIAATDVSSNGGRSSLCHRLGVRIALEDGDLVRARRHHDLALSVGVYGQSQAELVVLETALLQASGEDFTLSSKHSLKAAITAADAELILQAHLLCSDAEGTLERRDAAAHHLSQARAYRRRLANTLPTGLRERFNQRADLRRLDEPLRHLGDKAGGSPTPAAHHRVAATSPSGGHSLGSNQRMVLLQNAIARVGPTQTTIIIQGESGTGKELVADAIHRASNRRAGPLIKVNCAALVDTLLLSELFGHEKGAFTGAQGRKSGRFEQAHGGTLFLDEIGDISPSTQVALLRVLQERRFERVGGSSPIDVDVRIICATHRDLGAMVQQGTFREDLYYRLCGVRLEVPPLRNRFDDLETLCDTLLERGAAQQDCPRKRLSTSALALLERHPWPGNIRELDNALRAAAVFTEGELIGPGDLVQHVPALRSLGRALGRAASEADEPSHTGRPVSEVVYAEICAGTSLPEMKRELERACIDRALEDRDGNITKAAELLGMKRPRLSQLVNQFARTNKERAS